ncbi:dicarboxylate/amino acid:cation symporter [Eubacterium xylanophilum]|uniref:dicarboxylate/amino acid:cation symporter n=1 Tax=Eubacterium xylanophilum TaxID=39497 RepID=UPI00047EE2B7|nr:dicarboxylate/amino acid:cation symporter [Eubacterium xylanophilum]
MRFINEKKAFSSSDGTFLQESLEFIEDILTKIDLPRKTVNKAVLASEETIIAFQRVASEGAKLTISIKKSLGSTSIALSMEGEEFNPLGEEGILAASLESLESEEAIGSILLRSLGDKFNYRYKKGCNQARVTVNKSEQAMLYRTICAIVLGIIVGVLGKIVLPDNVSGGMCTYLLEPIKTMFMNALKIVLAPVIFFSIISCVSQFSNIAELGKIGAKIMGVYMLTSVIAMSVGFVLVSVFFQGDGGEISSFSQLTQSANVAVNVGKSADVSVLNTIVNIVPDNFLAPFFKSDTMQTIFLALLFGVAVGKIGEYSTRVKELFEGLNELFLKATMIIAMAIPFAVFASISSIIIKTDMGVMLSVLKLGLVNIAGYASMMIVYSLMILITTRLNPIKFFKNARDGMIASFTLSSSAAAMPHNMRVCTEKMGIAAKISNFSIPLGATVNMDGSCVSMVIISIFLAGIYNIEMTPAALGSLFFTVIVLSFAAPGVPGGSLVGLGVVLSSLNVPLEAMAIPMAIYSILDMFSTMSNTTGDVAATLVVAKNEGEVDEEVYYS